MQSNTSISGLDSSSALSSLRELFLPPHLPHGLSWKFSRSQEVWAAGNRKSSRSTVSTLYRKENCSPERGRNLSQVIQQVRSGAGPSLTPWSLSLPHPTLFLTDPTRQAGPVLPGIAETAFFGISGWSHAVLTLGEKLTC